MNGEEYDVLYYESDLEAVDSIEANGSYTDGELISFGCCTSFWMVFQGMPSIPGLNVLFAMASFYGCIDEYFGIDEVWNVPSERIAIEMRHHIRKAIRKRIYALEKANH